MKIVVLISTYNGEAFIAEQLRSILDQLPTDARVLVRDDGSIDRTLQTIDRFKDHRINIIHGENVGFCRSFFLLIEAVPSDADIIFLSDQDDVWLPNKVARVCAAMGGLSRIPAVYCGRMQLVDVELRPLGTSAQYPRGASFEGAFAENIVTGCAAAFNRRALPLVSQYGDVNLIHFHDWWIYLVVSAFGRVLVDETPTIMYRQHGSNVVGMGRGWRRALAVLRFLIKQNWVHIMFAQAENFRRVHGASLSQEQREYIARYFKPRDTKSAWRIVLSLKRFRQTLIDDVILRLLVLVSLLSGKGIASDYLKSRRGN